MLSSHTNYWTILTPLGHWVSFSYCLKCPFPAGFPHPTPLFTWRAITFLLVSAHLIWEGSPVLNYHSLLSFLFSLYSVFVGKIKHSALKKDIWTYGGPGSCWAMSRNSGIKGLGIMVFWVWIPVLALDDDLGSVILPPRSLSPQLFNGGIGLKGVWSTFHLWYPRFF